MTKRKSLPLLAISVVLLALVAFVSVPKIVSPANAHDIPASKFDSKEFSDLTYGIYWYTADSDVPVKAKDATNFDPTKPTLLYAHGMKYMHEGLQQREGLSLKDNNKEFMNAHGFDDYRYEEEFYKTLIDQGYNVGVFFWNQLADVLFTEECRFWTTESENGMFYCYVDEDGSYASTGKYDERNPQKTVTALYRDCIIEALGSDFSGHLQLAGHSMGGQLTLAVSQALCVAFDKGEIGSNLLPDRVTLLDPYLGSRLCSGVVDTTGEEIDNKPAAALAAEAAENVAGHGIPIEAYGVNELMVYRYFATPMIGIKDKDEVQRVIQLFSDNIAWVYLDAMMDTYEAFIPTHTMAVDYYFSTMYMTPVYDNGGVQVPSFMATDDYIRRLKGYAFRQDYDTSIAHPNPIYQCESVYVRINGVTGKEIRRPDPLPRALTGTVSETEKTLTVKLMSGDEVVAETVALKGKYVFSDVYEGDYSIAVYSGDVKVSSVEEINVSSDDVTEVSKQIKVEYQKEDAQPEQKGIDKTTFLLIVVGFAVIVLLALLFYKKSRG